MLKTGVPVVLQDGASRRLGTASHGYLREGGLWHCLGSLVGCKVRASLSRRASPMYAEAVSHSPVLNAASYECSADRGAERQPFAVAMTLLIFDLRVMASTQTHTSLLHLVQRLAPYLGYAVSFLIIGTIWTKPDVTPCKTAMVETRAGLRPSTLPRTRVVAFRCGGKRAFADLSCVVRRA